MSYNFTMSFLHAENKAEAYTAADRLAKAILEPNVATAILKSNLFSFLFQANQIIKKQIAGPTAYHLESWLVSSFMVRCTYWPEHRLLGISGDWPKQCLGLTGKPVFFQNSTDQDYELELWPELPFFQERIKIAQSISDEEVAKSMDVETSDMDGHPAYYRLSSLYQRIFDDLDLNDWLYNTNDSFERFAMSGIVNSDVLFKLSTRARMVIQEMDL